MRDKIVKYYFAYNSPFSFLANMPIAHDLAQLGTELVYKPVYSPRTSERNPDLNSPKINICLKISKSINYSMKMPIEMR